MTKDSTEDKSVVVLFQLQMECSNGCTKASDLLAVGELGEQSHDLCGGDKFRALPDRCEGDFGKVACLAVEDLSGAMPRAIENEDLGMEQR